MTMSLTIPKTFHSAGTARYVSETNKRFLDLICLFCFIAYSLLVVQAARSEHQLQL